MRRIGLAGNPGSPCDGDKDQRFCIGECECLFRIVDLQGRRFGSGLFEGTERPESLGLR